MAAVTSGGRATVGLSDRVGVDFGQEEDRHEGRSEIRKDIIELLAAKKRCQPAELERQLKDKGPQLPIDSHRLVRVAPQLAKALGIKIKFNRQLAPHLKSVETLVDYVYELTKREAA